MLKTGFFVLLLSSFLFHLTTGLYFHMAETQRKCFFEEIPDETTVLGKQKKVATLSNQLAPALDQLSLQFSHLFSVHYKVELYDPRSGGSAPPNTGNFLLKFQSS